MLCEKISLRIQHKAMQTCNHATVDLRIMEYNVIRAYLKHILVIIESVWETVLRIVIIR
jgi:hypothetical protein